MRSKVILNYLARIWELFKRGTRNVNFVLSLYIISILQDGFEVDALLAIPIIGIAIAIGYADYKLISGQAQPRLNPYTQDFLLHRIITNRGNIFHSEGNYESAAREYKRANLILLNWVENDTILKHWEVDENVLS